MLDSGQVTVAEGVHWFDCQTVQTHSSEVLAATVSNWTTGLVGRQVLQPRPHNTGWRVGKADFGDDEKMMKRVKETGS